MALGPTLRTASLRSALLRYGPSAIARPSTPAALTRRPDQPDHRPPRRAPMGDMTCTYLVPAEGLLPAVTSPGWESLGEE